MVVLAPAGAAAWHPWLAEPPEVRVLRRVRCHLDPVVYDDDPVRPGDDRVEVDVGDLLVNPITWPEPFGLVMAQALAAATPVLAFPNGAAPEIIDHGRTGYLCRDEDEMSAAAAQIGEIDRRQRPAAAERRFSLARTAAHYQRLYRAILETPGRATTGRTGTGAP
jgi:glycosyltransferase involved in cell wall biosynthesis